MSTENEIHVDDIGTEVLVTVVDCDTLDGNGDPTPIDISSATIMLVRLEKSDKVVIEGAAAFTTVGSGGAGDGTDGQMSYFSIAGDLDLSGNYRVQGRVTTPEGVWSSSIEKFKVYQNL